MLSRTFKMDTQLKPSEVYCAAIGMFEANRYELVEIIEESEAYPGNISERARVYQHPKTLDLHVLYFPGKDNDEPNTAKDTTTSLRTIRKEVASKSRVDLSKAIHSMVVCESNRFYGVKVDHYIYAFTQDGTLTTDDSINRDYDESYIDALCQHDKRVKKKRGWQRMLFDDWQCGHFALQALHRKITGAHEPKRLKIDELVIGSHDEYYNTGSRLVKRGFEEDHPVTLSKSERPQLAIEKAVPSEENAIKRHASTDDDFDVDAILNASRPHPDESSPLLPRHPLKKPGFFQRHPWVKTALIGFGVGLFITGLVVAAAAITVATMGAGAPAIAAGVLTVGAVIGAKVGLAGAAATGVGLAALSVGVGGVCAATGGVVGAVASKNTAPALLTSEAPKPAVTHSQTTIRIAIPTDIEAIQPERPTSTKRLTEEASILQPRTRVKRAEKHDKSIQRTPHIFRK